MTRLNRWPYELYRGEFKVRDKKLDRKTFRIKKIVSARVNSSPPFSQYDNYAEYNYSVLDSHGKYTSKCYFENGSRGNFKFPSYYKVKIEEINEMSQAQIEKRGNGNTALMTLPTVDGWTDSQIATIKTTVAPNATHDELAMFLTLAKRYDLDPFRKEIMFLKFNGQVACYTGKDGYFKAAHKDPGFAGLKSGVVKEGDMFEADFEACMVSHKIGATRGKIRGAWAIAYHKDPDRPPIIEWAEFDEYNRADFTNWKKYPSTMIQKVAEIHALKKQFQISGLELKECDISEEERYEDTRKQLMMPRITPEEKAYKVRTGRLLRSFHSIGVTTEMIEQYLGMAIDDIGDREINEISEIGKEIIYGGGTWQQITAPFGIDAIDIQPQPSQSQTQDQCSDHLPNMDGTPWAGERFNQDAQSTASGNGKEKLLRSKIKGKLEAIFPGNFDDQNGWLDDHFSTTINGLDALNLESLQPILDSVDKLFDGRQA